MRVLIDFIIINLSAISAFIFREIAWWFIKEPPSKYLSKYIWTLLFLNIVYLFVFWVLGLYDKRQKRALLEEFVLIFGVVSTGIAILIAILFLGRLWWMSRAVLFVFWGLSITLLCFSRFLIKTGGPARDISRTNLPELESAMKQKVKLISPKFKESLSIIIVCINEKDKLSMCLDSLKRAELKVPIDIIVVDNNSSDGTVQFLKSKHPEVKIIQNDKNLGYPRSVNNGLRAAGTNLRLILNPDIVVLPGAIAIMMNYMLGHPKIGLIGCKLLNEDGTLQYSVRRFLDLRTYLYRFTPLRGLMTGSALERFYLMQDWDHKDNRIVDWVLGGCMMVRRSAIDEVGMMDENIFLYFDDVDWCYRMWEKGWQVAYVAEAAMVHKHMRTSANKMFSRATFEHFKSLFYFLRKHGLRLPENCPSRQELV